jgi:hypothetical protein
MKIMSSEICSQMAGNIKIDLKEIGCEELHWILLVHDRV